LGAQHSWGGVVSAVLQGLQQLGIEFGEGIVDGLHLLLQSLQLLGHVLAAVVPLGGELAHPVTEVAAADGIRHVGAEVVGVLILVGNAAEIGCELAEQLGLHLQVAHGLPLS
jgi:hypothetical protein